jgi:hypothetical protein
LQYVKKLGAKWIKSDKDRVSLRWEYSIPTRLSEGENSTKLLAGKWTRALIMIPWETPMRLQDDVGVLDTWWNNTKEYDFYFLS